MSWIRILAVSLGLVVLGAGCGSRTAEDAGAPAPSDSAPATQQTSYFTLSPIDTGPFAEVFAKGVEVFGVQVVATEGVADFKVLHAAGVLAQYLDNDEDGVPDNQAVVDAMVAEKAVLVMFADFEERDSRGRALWESGEVDDYAMQDLEGHETLPADGGFDATIEEVLHLVTFAGYEKAYPEVFGSEPGSEISDAMDIARGGRFMEVPDEYPEEAWYHYTDETCEYGCMVHEYFYWALTTLLDAQSDPDRCEWLADEWELCTPEALRENDVAIYALLTNPEYKLATVLPNGDYNPSETE
jgi:hypothetical protein